MKTKFRTQYDPRRVRFSFDGVKSLTDPQFRDDCSIVGIIRKYGIVPPPTVKPICADVSEIGDFQTAMESINDALGKFSELPSELRSEFGNSPTALFSWLSNPDNREKAVKYGLIDKPVEVEDKHLAALEKIAENTAHRETEK